MEPVIPPAARTAFLGLDFDRLDLAGALDWIAARDAAAPFAYVVTPNVDHMVRLEALPGVLRRAYETADLCLCDSRILQRLARLLGVTLTLAPGSDMTAALFRDVLRPGDRVCLIGGTASDATQLSALHPRLEIVQHVPPMGLLHDAAARRAAIDAAAAARARIVLLAVGSPQQELIAWEMRDRPGMRGTALCIGASVDFLVGRQRRAPRFVQRLGVEWAWRLAGNPRRLARRYLVEGPAIFPLAWRWSRQRRKG